MHGCRCAADLFLTAFGRRVVVGHDFLKLMEPVMAVPAYRHQILQRFEKCIAIMKVMRVVGRIGAAHAVPDRLASVSGAGLGLLGFGFPNVAAKISVIGFFAIELVAHLQSSNFQRTTTNAHKINLSNKSRRLPKVGLVPLSLSIW